MATTRHPDSYDLYGPDTRRMADSFKRERTWKIAAVLGSMALVVGGLLAVAAGDFNRRFDTGETSAPAVINPDTTSTDPAYGSPDTSGVTPGAADQNTVTPGPGDQGPMDQAPGVVPGTDDTSGARGNDNTDQPSQGNHDTDRDMDRDTERGTHDVDRDTDDTGSRGRANDGTDPGDSNADRPNDGSTGTERMPPEGHAPR